MLIIRLQRVGKKNEPTFRIVLTDSKNGPKSGKFLEILGSYDARDKNESKVDADRVKELIANGAQVSDTVRNFLITKGVIEGDKVNVLPKKTPIVKESEEGEGESKEADAPTTEDNEEKPAEEPKEEPAPADDSAEEKTEEKPEESKEETPEPKKEEEKPETDEASEEKKEA